MLFSPAKITVNCMEQNFDLTKSSVVIANTIQKRKRKRKIYLDVTNKCQHVTENECEIDQQG